jgi:hypothetical protein
MAKYEPLGGFLGRQSDEKYTIQVSFRRLEEIIGGPLPASARRRREWWGNEAGGTHVQAHAWLNAGWSVDRVDLDRGVVTFRRGRP